MDIDRTHYRYRYFGLDRDVIKILIEQHGFSQQEAEKAIKDYSQVFRLADKYTEAWHIAFRISLDKKHGFQPDHYIETLSFFNDAGALLADMKKMPVTGNRPHEFCNRCNYPKYKDEECRFCK